MEYPLNQSSWGRAKQDTISAQKTVRFMWGGEGVLAVAGGAWLAQIAPVGASITEIVVRSIIGGLGGLVTAILIILAWNLFWSPYRQRNQARGLLAAQPKPVPLSNRKELIGAIHQLKETARETIWRNDIARGKRESNDSSGKIDAIIAYQKAYDKYSDAEKRLECEKDIAGGIFGEPIVTYQNAMKLHVLSRELPTASDYPEILTKLDAAVKQVVNEIDTISQ